MQKQKKKVIVFIPSPELEAQGVTSSLLRLEALRFLQGAPDIRNAFLAYEKAGTAEDLGVFSSQEILPHYRVTYMGSMYEEGKIRILLYVEKNVEIPFSELSREERDKLGIGDGPESSDDED